MSDGLFDETSAAGLAQQALERTLAALRTIQAQARIAAEARAAIAGERAAIADLLQAAGVAHRWTGTALQLRLPDGSFGEAVDLVGPAGPPGPPLSLAEGTVTSADQPDFRLTPDPGNPLRYILDLVLPRGERGEKGDTPTLADLDLSGLVLPWAQIAGRPPIPAAPQDIGAQPYDADLAALAGLATQAFGRGLLTFGSEAEVRAALLLGSAALRAAGAAGGVATLDGAGLVPLAQIPPLDAAQITSGVLDPARLGVVATRAQVMSAGGLADLTSGQKSAVVAGAVVTTTDGSRYLYSGSGDKTVPASYVLLADVTPEWDALANKPASFPPSAHTHTAAQISDASAVGRALLAIADKPALAAYLALAIGDITGLQSALNGKAAASFATASDLWAGTDAGKIVTAAVLKAAQVPQLLAVAGGAVAWDMVQGFNARLSLTATASLSAPTNPLANVDYYLDVVQPASGGPFTLSYAAAFNFGAGGAPSLSTGAGKRDKLAFRCSDATAGAVKFDFLGIRKGL